MQRFTVTLVTFAALAATIWSVLPLEGAWPTDPTVNVPLCTAVADQQTTSASATSDGAGGAIVVWSDRRNGLPDLYSQRVAANGDVLWTADGVPVCTAAGTQSEIRTVSDGAGGAIVVWRDRRGSDYDYYAQRVDADGEIRWPAAFPSLDGTPVCTVSGDQEAMEAVADGTGGVVVVWRHHDPADDGVFVQRLDAEGEITWPASAPSGAGVRACDSTHGEFDPDLALDDVGGVIVAWQDSRNSATTESDVYAQRFNSDGVRQWSSAGVPVCVEDLGQTMPIVAGYGGGAIVAWQDFRPAGSDYGVGVQRMSQLGLMQWPAEGLMVNETFVGGDTSKAIAGDGSGGAYLVWMDRRNVATTGNDIYAQRVNSAGQMLWPTTGAPVTQAPAQQSSLDLVSGGAGGVFVAWGDHRADSNDIYAQHLDSAGLRLGPVDGLEVCTEASGQYSPTMVDDGAGGVIIAWYDYRNTSTTGADIYAQQAFDAGLIFGDGFEGGDTGEWGAVVP